MLPRVILLLYARQRSLARLHFSHIIIITHNIQRAIRVVDNNIMISYYYFNFYNLHLWPIMQTFSVHRIKQ